MEGNFVLVLVLAVFGMAEAAVFLYGKQQVVSFVKRQSSHLTLIVSHGPAMIAAAVGSLVLATVMGAVRAPSVRLWRQGGQVWRKGTAVTVALWLVSLVLHLGYDAVVARGRADANFGAATTLLYLAVSLAAQNVVLLLRAWRLTDEAEGWPDRPRSSGRW